MPRLRFQAAHSLDVGDAYRRALLSNARGAFNLAADPPIGPTELAEIFNARKLRVSPTVLRRAVAATFKMRLQPTEPGWLDMALAVPLLDNARARAELGWLPQRSSTETLRELIDAIRAGGDYDTPPLTRKTRGIGRIRELATGVGKRP